MRSFSLKIKGNKYNISCIEYEPEDKTADFAVVCLHGFGGDKSSSAVRMLAQRITEKGGAVVAFDFPAHGESEAGEDMLTMEHCIFDAKKVYSYAEEKYGKADFFATSFGAYVLINLLKSDDLKGIKAVLRSPAVKMADTFLSPICNLSSEELKNREYIECGFERRIKLGYGFWQDLREHSVDNVLFANECLMIYGDRDDVVKPADMAEFAMRKDNIKACIIKGADHRFKGEGQLEAAIEAAADFLIG